MARRANCRTLWACPLFIMSIWASRPRMWIPRSNPLVDVLGYRQMALDDNLRGLGARWYEADDGSQVHLSLDPDHRPAASADVAVGYGADLNEVERRLEKATVEFESFQREGLPRESSFAATRRAIAGAKGRRTLPG